MCRGRRRLVKKGILRCRSAWPRSPADDTLLPDLLANSIVSQSSTCDTRIVNTNSTSFSGNVELTKIGPEVGESTSMAGASRPGPPARRCGSSRGRQPLGLLGLCPPGRDALRRGLRHGPAVGLGDPVGGAGRRPEWDRVPGGGHGLCRHERRGTRHVQRERTPSVRRVLDSGAHANRCDSVHRDGRHCVRRRRGRDNAGSLSRRPRPPETVPIPSRDRRMRRGRPSVPALRVARAAYPDDARVFLPPSPSFAFRVAV